MHDLENYHSFLDSLIDLTAIHANLLILLECNKISAQFALYQHCYNVIMQYP